jgi:hypothetical protein
MGALRVQGYASQEKHLRQSPEILGSLVSAEQSSAVARLRQFSMIAIGFQ